MAIPKPSVATNSNLSAVYDSVSESWSGDVALLVPGALRSVEPISRSFGAISEWIDAVCEAATASTMVSGSALHSDKVVAGNLAAQAAVSVIADVADGDTFSKIIKMLEYRADHSAVNSTRGGVPAGAISAFAMTTPPDGWLKCNGASVDRAGTYAALYAAIGTTWGTADSSHFNVPDLRGQFLRAWADDGVTYDAGRVFASTQADVLKAHTHNTDLRDFMNSASAGTGRLVGASSFTATASSSTGDATETRPRNIAVAYFIKY